MSWQVRPLSSQLCGDPEEIISNEKLLLSLRLNDNDLHWCFQFDNLIYRSRRLAITYNLLFVMSLKHLMYIYYLVFFSFYIYNKRIRSRIAIFR